MHFFWSGGCDSGEPGAADWATGMDVAHERAAGRAGRAGATGGGGGNGGVAAGAWAPGPAGEAVMVRVDAMGMDGAGTTGRSIDPGCWTRSSASRRATPTEASTWGRWKFSAKRSGW